MSASSQRSGTRPAHDLAETERIRREYQRRAREIPADFYSLSRPAVLFGYTQRIRKTVQALAKAGCYPPATLRICDVGCGAGQWLVDFVNWGAEPRRISAIDLDVQRLGVARERIPGADLREGNATCLPWENDSFDLVLQSTVFTSILDLEMKRAAATEMLRVLKPGGVILWYDFRYNNPRNPNVRGIEAAEIRSLFPGCRVDLRRVTLAPPIARRLAPVSWIGALLLEKIPFLRTHYLGIIRKPEGT
ncbi:MAG: methyltransferase domain-containing protein [Acidobacteria bacterium]|nr:methyltransferase domain-containing protein [Acidobacteriota bacterium]